jgi:hypothetical protein
MIPKDLFLILNLRLKLDDSILIFTSIFIKPLIHVRAGFSWVIQIIQILHHPRRALLVVPHERTVQTGLRQLRLYNCQDHLMCHKNFLFGNHLYRVLLHDDLLRYGSSRWRRSWGWRHSNRGAVASPPASLSSSLASASSPIRSSPISLVISEMSSLRDSTYPRAWCSLPSTSECLPSASCIGLLAQ